MELVTADLEIEGNYHPEKAAPNLASPLLLLPVTAIERSCELPIRVEDIRPACFLGF